MGVGADGLKVNLGRVGVGAAEVAWCDGDGFALADAEEEAGAGGAAPAVAVALVVGCALVGAPPAGPVPVGAAPAAASSDGRPDWLDRPDWVPVADRGGWPPLSARTATIPVAMIATTTTATAAVIPDSASIRRRGGLTGSGKPFGRNGPARWVTSPRYVSAPGRGLVHSCSTSSRSSSGGSGNGGMPWRMAGRSAPSMWSAQTSHWSM